MPVSIIIYVFGTCPINILQYKDFFVVVGLSLNFNGVHPVGGQLGPSADSDHVQRPRPSQPEDRARHRRRGAQLLQSQRIF